MLSCGERDEQIGRAEQEGSERGLSGGRKDSRRPLRPPPNRRGHHAMKTENDNRNNRKDLGSGDADDKED